MSFFVLSFRFQRTLDGMMGLSMYAFLFFLFGGREDSELRIDGWDGDEEVWLRCAVW